LMPGSYHYNVNLTEDSYQMLMRTPSTPDFAPSRHRVLPVRALCLGMLAALILGCGGRKQLSDTFTWHSTDSSIVSVGTTSGVVTARAAGQADVNATGAEYGSVGHFRVTVH
ncbi:MAG: Ig-like domain-containing protein, partial [Gemmatimonadaceae bacterium]